MWQSTTDGLWNKESRPMIAEWKPYPQIRPPVSGTYLVTYKTGGVQFRHYNRTDDNSGAFTDYKAEVVAWDFRPRPYEEGSK